MALLLARGHRFPYALLFPTVILMFINNADNIALIVCDNLSSDYDLPDLLFPALDAINLLSNSWATLLLYLAILAVLWNRESAIRVATEGKAGRRNPALIAVHAVLAVFIFVLGTAGPAVFVDALVKYETTSDVRSVAVIDYRKQRKVFEKLSYVYSTFVVLTGVDVALSTVLLWSASRTARVTDKITNMMLYVVVPLYALLNLFFMIFTIVFSDKGVPFSSITSYEGALLANNLLLLLFSFAVITALLFLAGNHANWVVQGGVVQPDTGKPVQQHWSPPYNGPYQGQPVGQPMYYYNGPHPYMPNAPLQQAPYQQVLYQQTPYQHPSPPQQLVEQPPSQQLTEHHPIMPQPEVPVAAAQV